MDGRKRTVQIKFRVTEAERDLILEKMKLIPTRNMAAYLRKIAIDGYIVQVDHTDIKAMTAEIQKIGVNVNQIAKRVNSTGSVYQAVSYTHLEHQARALTKNEKPSVLAQLKKLSLIHIFLPAPQGGELFRLQPPHQLVQLRRGSGRQHHDPDLLALRVQFHFHLHPFAPFLGFSIDESFFSVYRFWTNGRQHRTNGAGQLSR